MKTNTISKDQSKYKPNFENYMKKIELETHKILRKIIKTTLR